MRRIPGDRNELPLAQAINRQLENEKLDTVQLQQLMTMQQAVLEASDSNSSPINRRFWRQAAALCATLLLGVFLVWQTLAPSGPNYAQEIALEVAQNHLKLKPLDIAAHSMAEIQGFFTQLDFSPVSSDLLEARFALPERSILGGRYCSIKGFTAAQLRYRQSDDGLSTLYEVPYDIDAFGPMPSVDQGEQPRELILKGLKISLWVEKGLLMALVTDA